MKRWIPRFALPACLFSLLLWSVGATQIPEEKQYLDDHRYLGKPLHIENLTVWPVHTSRVVEVGDYLSLHDAQKRGLAEVRERGSGDASGREEASVGELEIVNLADRPIFVPAGTVLKGGNQDRQLGEDLVISAKTTVPVGAYCIEKRRWSQNRDGEATAGRFKVVPLVAAKRVRASAQYKRDQGRVWEQVDRVNQKARKRPATSTFLATVEEDASPALAKRQEIEAAVRSHFEALGRSQAGEDPTVGFAYAINGEPMAARAFAHPQLLASHFEPFLKTMSLEAQVALQRDRAQDRPPQRQAASSEALLLMVQGLRQASSETRATAGLNENRYQVNEWGGHSTCLVPKPRARGWIPLSEDWTVPAEPTEAVRHELRRLKALGYTEP